LSGLARATDADAGVPTMHSLRPSDFVWRDRVADLTMTFAPLVVRSATDIKPVFESRRAFANDSDWPEGAG